MTHGKRKQKGSRRHFTSTEELKKKCEELRKRSVEDSNKENVNSQQQQQQNENLGLDWLFGNKNPNQKLDEVAQELAQIKLYDADDDATSSDSEGGGNQVGVVRKYSTHKCRLSRSEREELDKQKSPHRWDGKLQTPGSGLNAKARADLARLAIVRREREAAAAKREAKKRATAEMPKNMFLRSTK